MISTRNYAATTQYTAEDKGIPALRRVMFGNMLAQSFTHHVQAAAFPAPNYIRDRVVRQEFDVVLAALVDPLNDYERNISHAPASGFLRDPLYIPSTTPEAIARYAQFSNNRLGANGEVIGPFMGSMRGQDPATIGHMTPGNRILNTARPTGTGVAAPHEFPFIDNHNFPNTWFPSNRYPLSSRESTIARDWNSLIGDSMEDMNRLGVNAVANRETDTITFTGTSSADVYNQFQVYAQEFLFGDGLPLIPPTREMVDWMLTGTDRAPDEVIGGKIVGRMGVPTVEKIAINAVMVGAKPEYLPIIIAAVEAFSNDQEHRTDHFHALTSGGSFGYMLVVSGPIVEEIGLNTGAGYFGGAGNQANDTIGRAFRMSLRNIGHNWLGYMDTPRQGRMHEIVFPVVAEDESALPPGWLTYREQMGFGRSQNVVSIQSTSRDAETTIDSAGVDLAWTTNSLITQLRNQNDRGNPLIIMIGPAHAAALHEAGWTDIDALRRNTSTDEFPFPPGFANGLGNNNDSPRELSTWIIVTGEDPTRATSFGSTTHGGGATFGTVLITGAPLSNAVVDLAPPGTPQNFSVEPGPVPGTATLRWDLPVTAGRAPISHFEATAQTRGLERWVVVPGGADAREVTLTHLDGGRELNFRVRAVSGTHTPAYTPGAAFQELYYFGGRRVPVMHGDPGPGTGVNATTMNVFSGWDTDVLGTGTAGTNAVRSLGAMGGRGAQAAILWYHTDKLQNDSPFDLDNNGVRDTGPSEIFWIIARQAAEDDGIYIEWRPGRSTGGAPITGYEFSTDNGLTWKPMNNTTGRGLALPWAEDAIPGVNAGIRHNGRFTIEVQSANGEPLVPGTIYDILVRGVNAVGHGSFAGQTALQGANTAWPFQTHHRGPADAAIFPGTPGANSIWVQNNSRNRVVAPGGGTDPIAALALELMGSVNEHVYSEYPQDDYQGDNWWDVNNDAEGVNR